MTNLAALFFRRWWVSRQVHLATLLISTLVVTGWLFIWGYAEQTGDLLGSRVARPPEPADVMLRLPHGSAEIAPTAFLTEVYSFKTLTADTPFGRIELGAVRGLGRVLPAPLPGQLLVTDTLAERWRLQPGERLQIAVRLDYRFLDVEVEVGGAFAASDFLPAALVDAAWLTQQQVRLPAADTVFYNRVSENPVRLGDQRAAWLHSLPRHIERLGADSMVAAGERLGADSLRRGQWTAFLLFLFMAVGVGTFCLLLFLDGKRELSILKALGLRPREVSLLTGLETWITTLPGWTLAVLAATPLIAQLGLPVLITPGIRLRSLLWLQAALGCAVYVPCLLGLRSSVLDLQLGRPVPLLFLRQRELARRYPALEGLLAAGYCCIKLPCGSGQFDGICFRSVGQRVLPDETVAWESMAWGLIERSYQASCQGTVVTCDLSQGLIVIEPDKPKG